MNGAQYLVKGITPAGVTQVLVIRVARSCQCTTHCTMGVFLTCYVVMNKARRWPLSVTHALPVKSVSVSPLPAQVPPTLITGLADALLDSVPVVALTGQVASPLIGTDAFQEVDVLGLSLACTKHSFMVQSVDELGQVVADAFRIARSGRPGPVLVDIPKDIPAGKAELDTLIELVAEQSYEK